MTTFNSPLPGPPPSQPGHTRGITATETHVITSCVRRTTDSIEKRWCFDVTAQEKATVITFQAMGRKDREEWLAALEGKEPDYAALGFIGAGVLKMKRNGENSGQNIVERH